MTQDITSKEEQDNLEEDLDILFQALSLSAFLVLMKHLREVQEKELTYTQALALMPEKMAEIDSIFGKVKANAEAFIESMFNGLGDSLDTLASKYYKASGTAQKAWKEHATIKGMIKDGKLAASGFVDALVDTKVVGIVDSKGAFTKLDKYYKQKVSKAVTELLSGSDTYENVASRTAKELSKSGLRVKYAPYNKDGDFVTRELYAALRTNIMDSFRRTMSNVRMFQGMEFGADGVEVTAHALCAEDHQPYQGLQFSYETRRGYDKWDDVQNSLARPIEVGANCGHQVFPVILGVDIPAYTNSELDRLKELSNKQVDFAGVGGQTLTMTRYQASQYQRGVERKLRQLKAEDMLGNGDVKREIKRLTEYYSYFTDETGLTYYAERIKAHVIK